MSLTPAREPMVIGLCTYNRGPAIRRTLDALEAQRRTSGLITGLIVVDNRSNDETAAVVDRFAATASLPTRRVYEETPGKSAAMRRLFREAETPIVAMIDDDCLPEPRWAEALLGLMHDVPRCGAAGGPVRIVWEDGPTRIATIYKRSLGDQLLGEQRVKLHAPASFLMGASLAVRLDAVRQSGWMNAATLDCKRGATLECGEDAELQLLMRRAGWEIWYEPGAAMGHLIPQRRTTTAYIARLRESICKSEPTIKWLSHPSPTADWARREAERARRLWLKTLLFDWRPTRRTVRLAERRGRRDGWEELARRVSASEVIAPPNLGP